VILRTDSKARGFARGALLAVLVTGCAASVPPPPLPALARGHTDLTDCAEISGHYADRGQAFAEDGSSLGEVSFSRVLGIVAEGTDAVDVFQVDKDVLVVTPSAAGERGPSRRYTRYTWSRGWGWNAADWGQPYYCSRGFLLVGVAARKDTASSAAVLAESVDLLMRKGVDESLLVLCHGSAAGLLLGIPFAAHSNAWFRFPVGQAVGRGPSVLGKAQPSPFR
jgi:hypothetical protein